MSEWLWFFGIRLTLPMPREYIREFLKYNSKSEIFYIDSIRKDCNTCNGTGWEYKE